MSACYNPISVSMSDTLWRQRGCRSKILHTGCNRYFSFRCLLWRQGKKSGSHHFPLLTQPNCRGDVIFPPDRCRVADRFCNAKLQQILQKSKMRVCNFISRPRFRILEEWYCGSSWKSAEGDFGYIEKSGVGQAHFKDAIC